MNTSPVPERTCSLSSKNVKALSYASGSDLVYALTDDEVSVFINSLLCFSCCIIPLPKQLSNSPPDPPAMYVNLSFLHNFPTILHLSSSPLLFPKKVHRLPVEECSNFTDCSNCITNGGLLCGWCTVENKCSRRPQCANSNSSDGLRWVQTTDKCLTVDIESAVSISGDERAYPRETSSIVSWHLVTPLDGSKFK